MAASFIYVTMPDEAAALVMGRTLVEERLAACANVLPRMTSVYRWQGRVEQAAEAVLIVKTIEDRLLEAIARIKAFHTYECPCIVSWKIDQGNPDYLDWIERESR